MDPVHSSEISHSLSMLPYFYGHSSTGRRLWLIVILQVIFCVSSSLCMSYFCYKKFFSPKGMSWKKAVEVMQPIGKRLQNLEKEREIWNSYLEWVEDYCTLYYGLLSYLNNTVTDLDKIYKGQEYILRNLSESSGMNNSECEWAKFADSQEGGMLPSETSCDGIPSDEDVQLLENFARVLANLKNQVTERLGSGDVKRESSGDVKREGSDSKSGFSFDLTTLNDSFGGEVDTLKGTSDEKVNEDDTESENNQSSPGTITVEG